MTTQKTFMENRREDAHAQILKKLRTNQDFLMTTTVSNKPEIWTRWHQDRMINNEVNKSVGQLKNKRYGAVSTQYKQKRRLHERTFFTNFFTCFCLDCPISCPGKVPPKTLPMD